MSGRGKRSAEGSGRGKQIAKGHGPRITVGTFADFYRTGNNFLSWLEAVYEEVFIPADYWAPELAKLDFVTMLPVGFLDRNEILLAPRAWSGVPISISWSMPIGIAVEGLRGQIIRGGSNCWTCAHHCGGLLKPKCEARENVCATDRYIYDLGQCEHNKLGEAGIISSYETPVWWRDSDWPIAPGRYSPLAYDPLKLYNLLGHKPVESPLRRTPIPLTPREVAGGLSRPASPSRKGWLDFLTAALSDHPGGDVFIEEAKKVEFHVVGGS